MRGLPSFIAVSFLLLLSTGGSLSGQSAKLSFRNFTTDDGLPSSETYFVMEDRKGFLWVGTDNGLARFDGYEFTVFDTDDGLEDSVVFMIQETADGTIWVSTLSGRVFYYTENKFHPYEHNDLILELKQSNELMYLLDVLPDSQLVMRINYQGLIQIDQGGEIRWLTEDRNDLFYLYRPFDKNSSFPRQVRYHFGDRGYKGTVKKTTVVAWKNNQWEPFGQEPVYFENLATVRPSFLDMEAAGNGYIIAAREQLIHLLPNGRKYEFDFKPKWVTHIMHWKDNQFFMGSNSGNGLLKLRLDYKSGEVAVDTFLNGRPISMVALDRKGGLWVTSLDAGLFYCPYPDQTLYVAEVNGKATHPMALELIDSTRMIGAYANGGLLYLDTKRKVQKIVDENLWATGNQADDIFYDPESSYVSTLNNWYKLTYQNGLPKFTKWIDPDKKNRYMYNAKEFGENSNEIYWTGTQSFGKINMSVDETKESFASVIKSDEYTHGLESYYEFPDGRAFIGTWYGLKQVMPDGSLRKENLGIEALSGRIERIIGWGKNRIAIGTRSSGVVIWTPEEHFVIGIKDSLASDIIRNLHVDQDGTLWVATLKGLSKLEAPNGGRPSVRTFNIGNGLLDNEVHDIDSYKGDLWLASSAGVYRFSEPAKDTVSLSPQIRQIVVNGQSVALSEDQSFKPEENFLTFGYSSINFSIGTNLLYRYRINQGQPWQYSRERQANYPNLPPGDYQFEVQSQNQDLVWSASSVVPFSIAQHWYLTWQAWIAGFLVALGGILYVFRRREANRRLEQELRLEISRLENSALHAQMNPHFVFNCLNSIQNFIIQNNTLQAARYLARFARLIRKTLNSSVRGVHSLADEYEMLDRYLELEKLRFKEVFDYKIEIDPQLHVDDIMIPPLLVQPFVENAVLHAFKEQTGGGVLEISFTGSSDLLVVTVTDNGVGIEPEKDPQKDSMGMEITRRRLEILKDKKYPGLTLAVKPQKDDLGNLVGTQVSLVIKPSKQKT